MQKWRGCFAIPMTPFDPQDRIDERVLHDEIDFCIESGARGICTPVMVSEFELLSEEERRLMVRLPVEISAGRVPVIANCAAVNTPLAVRYAEYAQEVGADGVIAMPPYILRADFETVTAYYRAIAKAVSIPVMIQNAAGPVLPGLSADQVVSLCSAIESVRWVKEEVPPPPQSIGALLAKKSPAVEGVMGGCGGRYLVTEWARGSDGVIIACQFVDILQQVWNLLDDGREGPARDLFEKILPGIVLEFVYGIAFCKEIMVRRGIFGNHRIRSKSRPLGEDDMKEIDRFWERIQPHLVWRS